VIILLRDWVMDVDEVVFLMTLMVNVRVVGVLAFLLRCTCNSFEFLSGKKDGRIGNL
jgi:hypothetical protein